MARISNFWTTVFDHDIIAQYVQPCDFPLLLVSLKSLSVSRFELDMDETNGDPRSFAIRFEFAKNAYFEDTVLEKRFWWCQSLGFVSEHVEISWKDGKDLTEGLLALAKAGNQKALKNKINEIGVSNVSFFAWFGYTGEDVSAEESMEEDDEDNEMDEMDEDDSEDRDGLGIFAAGEKLASIVAEDLWPRALKYYGEFASVLVFQAMCS